ncbi:hypothetical protein [Pseudomonas profundi]|uniref:hypothetical protein n=1 Tax=Pseudomonas profundi TaxID=1981513 RepID=UPI001CC23242|nr:hypothetical protein [Pseudomonas profundi]
MGVLMLFSVALLSALCLTLVLGGMDEERIEQAALIPFADDPDAAEQLTLETGRRCEKVVEPVAEPLKHASVAYLDA